MPDDGNGRPLVVGGDDRLTATVVAALAPAAAHRGPTSGGDRLERRLAAAGSVIYLAAARSRDEAPDLDDARRLLDLLAAAAGVRVVLVSSAAVHEPHYAHAGMLTEERLPPQAPANPISADWRRLEALARERLPDDRLAVLRPAAVPAAGRHSLLGRLFAGRFALVLAGHDPSVQLLDAEDLAAAVRRVLEQRAAATFNAAPAGVVPLRRALRLAGVRALPLPRTLARLFTPGASLDFIRYSWTISGARIEARLGFRPRWSSAATARRAAGRGVPVEARPAPGPATDGYDDFGQDTAYMARFDRTLWSFLHDRWWRVETRGLERLPRSGRAVLVGVHRGFMPWDAVMVLHQVIGATGRHPRFLIHPALIKFPFLFDYITKLGGVIACRENADRILERDGLLGIYPEGIRGAFCYYRDAYTLERFGRDEYVRIALRNRAPLLPFVTVGSAESLPVLAKLHWRWWRRWSGWPCLPITPTFPLLPLPLPSKWHTLYLEPLHVEERHPAAAADDPAAVRAIGEEVERRLQTAMDRMVERRPAIFWGSVFDRE